MVRMAVTPRLRDTLNTLADVKDGHGHQLPLELLDAIQAHLDSAAPWVEHSLLAKISRWNRTSQDPQAQYTLRALSRGSEVYFDPPEPAYERSKLEAILAPIRLAQEQAAYAAMLSGPHSQTSAYKDAYDTKTIENWDFTTASHPQASVKQELDAIRKELSAIANVVASMAAVATAVWWAAGTTPLAQKTLMSLFGAMAIAAIEGFLYVRYFQRVRSVPPKTKQSDKRSQPRFSTSRIANHPLAAMQAQATSESK